MSEPEFLEVIEALCKRPKLYTPTGTFGEVVSFLEGYGNGAWVGGAERRYHSVFTPFFRWLAGRQNRDPQFPLTWSELQELFLTDDDAFVKFPKLYEEYVHEMLQP